MIRAAVPALLLSLTACHYPLYDGRDNYSEGMRRLRYDPGSASGYFAEADRELAEALADEDLDATEVVLAVSLRARSLIELERHQEVGPLLSADYKGYNPERQWRGDPVGLSLLRATRLDPERAYGELLLAEKKAATLRARRHIAWEQVHALQKIGTPKAKAEAVKICEANAGKLDFDELKKALSNP